MAPESKIKNPNSKSLRILLVEDNHGDVDLIREMLSETETASFLVEAVPRLSEALNRLKSADIDIVLLDLGLPDSSGLDTLRKLWAAAPDLPMVVLTGNTNQETGLAAVREGAQDYLIKGQISGDIIVRSIFYALERKRADENIQRLNRVYRVLSSINQTIVRILEPQALFKEVCRIAVDEGGFRMAWIGLVDEESGKVEPVAHAGVVDGYLQRLNIMLNQEPRRQGPTASALRGGESVVCNDIARDPRMAPWREEALRRGYRASIALPFMVKGKIRGTFNLYAGKPSFFDVQELALLEELKNNISFGMEVAEKEEQRYRAEAELKQSEQFNRDILASVDEAFVVLDREYRIVTANKAYCELVEKPLEEILGRYCYEISHYESQPCQEPQYVCGYKRTFETGEPVTTVHKHTDSNGRPRQVEIKTYAMKDESGRVTSVIEVINDITEKTVLESQLRQAQKMEAIGTLAGGIAHDFNNILTAIIGFGEIVLEQLEPGSQVRDDQAHVVAAGKRASELVKQILTFSRQSEQELKPLLIQFVVKEALKMMRSSIPANIEIREDIDVNCGAVLADPAQIHQVVMNLCTNAYQAMRESGGVMTVSLKSVPLPEEVTKMTANLHPGPHLCLEVADTGSGMSRAVRERIFEPYYTTKGQGEGTGLGLSLVHGIVTGLGGTINVYSEPGLGATFKVYLPLTAVGSRRPPEVISEIPPGGAESIMVVDDEEAITSLERKLLEGLGYRVTVFNDGEEALLAFRAQPDNFDLLLTDMSMPRLNGDVLAREVLLLRSGMPIILCTGFSERIDAEKAKDLGIREFLLKPVVKGELAKAVRKALDGGTEVGN